MVISAKIDVMNVLQSPPPANRVEMLRLFNKGGVVAEIGVQCGEYAQHIYDVLQPREFYLIDCWDWGREPDLLTREHPTSWAIWKV